MQSKTIEENEIGRYLTYNNWRQNTPVKFGSRIKENTRYTLILKTDATSSVAAIVLFYSDDSYSNVTVPKGFATTAFVIPTNKTLKSIRVQQRSATVKFYIDGSGIFEGVLTAADYEPYVSTTQTITFPQTIYGGYVDLMKGEVVEKYGKLTFDGVNTKVNRNYTTTGDTNYIKSYLVYWTPRAYGAGQNVMCDTLKVVKNHNTIDSSNVPCLFTTNTATAFGGLILGNKSDYTELANATNQEIIDYCNEWFKNHPTTVVYDLLKTPTTYPLDTAQNLTTLRGANTIYSNSNDVTEITYFKHGDDAYTHIPVSNALSSNDNFILVTDDGYVIGDANDYIVY